MSARIGLLLLCAMTSSTCMHGPRRAASFAADLAFLARHVHTVVLSDAGGTAKVALVPAWQGRVVTSTAEGDGGTSFGWLNRELIASGEPRPHIHVFGGEDRFWIGPEGGQFSIFFPRGADFDFAHWQTPAPLDTEAYELTEQALDRAVFERRFELANWSGTRFEVGVRREIALVPAREVLGRELPDGLRAVAFRSSNTLVNRGSESWRRGSGLLSIWILGMFNATPRTAVVVPFESGDGRGQLVNDVYFGKVPAERLVVQGDVLLFRADAGCRSKIGVGPRRAKDVLGSWDAEHGVLTIVRYGFDPGAHGYVNSLWKLQDDPYDGDVVNSYNDGPAQPGEPQLGQFYELETSSAALALAPGASATHVHATAHLVGERAALDRVARDVLGVSLDEVERAFLR